MQAFKTSPWRRLLCLAALVFATSWASLNAAGSPTTIATVWFGDGIVLAAMLSSPMQQWPGLIIASLIGYLGAKLGSVTIWSMTPGLTAACAIEVAIPALWLRRRFGAEPEFDDWRTYLHFVATGVVIGPFVGGLLAASIFTLCTGQGFFTSFSHWFLAHSLGMGIVTPLVLMVLRGETAALFAEGRAARTLQLLALFAVVTGLVFWQNRYPLLFLIPPMMQYVAGKLGYAAATLEAPILLVLAFLFTAAGHGPLTINQTVSAREQIAEMQAFTFISIMLSTRVSSVARQIRRRRDIMVAKSSALAQLAATDPLTKLWNRRHLEKAAKAIAQQGGENQSVAFAILDVDYFKRYNDEFGHPAGDHCLCRIASILRGHAIEAGEVAARIGGEEFALLLPGFDLQAAMGRLEIVRAEVERAAMPHPRTRNGIVTVSIGVAATSGFAGDLSGLIAKADAALYRAKHRGRNCLVAEVTGAAAEREEQERVAIVEQVASSARDLISDKLNQLAEVVAASFAAPIALVSLVSDQSQLFAGRTGIESNSSPRGDSFCAHMIGTARPLVVQDATTDVRFAGTALVTGAPGIRYYAGAPMVTASGHVLGAVCVIDTVPRPHPGDAAIAMLSAFAAAALRILETGKTPETAGQGKPAVQKAAA